MIDENHQKAALRTVAMREDVQILRRALGADADLHLVGGAVRDLLLGQQAGDIDLATALPPGAVLERLESQQIRVIPTGLQHQTVTAVPIEGEANVEITTFRGAGMSPQGGVVQGTSIVEDLSYRDFTVNAIAYALESDQLIDPFSGRADLAARVLRPVGDGAARFQEDPLRILRLVRIAVQKNFAIEPSAAAVVTDHKELLHSVSIERVRDELSKIFISPAPARGLKLLLEYELLAVVLPEAMPMVRCAQNRFHKADVFEHTLEVVERTEPELVLRLAAFFHDIGKPATVSVDEVTGDRHFFHHENVGAEITRQALERLRFPNSVIDEVSLLVRTHMRPTEAGPGGLRRILRDTRDSYPSWRKLKEADILSCKLSEEEVSFRLAAFDDAIAEIRRGPQVHPLSSLAVNGTDLMNQFNLKPSRLIGDLLRALHERVLDEPTLNTKEALIPIAAEILRSRSALF